MRSTQLFTLVALLATSVSSMSIGHAPDQVAHRRHASADVHKSVLQARGARAYNPNQGEISERSETAPTWARRKRGLNQRRCAAKSSTSSLAPASTTSAAATSTPAPEPTTSAEPTTTKAKSNTSKSSQAATKTSTSAKSTPTSDDDDSGSSSGSTQTGEGTFYGTGLGACGITNVDTDMICAVSQLLFDGFEGYTGGDPNSNPICGRKIKATYEGKSVTVTVTDRCVGCKINDLDFSPSAFSKIADQALGRLTGVTWTWV